MEVQTGRVPGESHAFDQAPGLRLEVGNEVLIDDLDEGTGRTAFQ